MALGIITILLVRVNFISLADEEIITKFLNSSITSPTSNLSQIRPNEVYNVIQGLNESKSPGYDTITAKIL